MAAGSTCQIKRRMIGKEGRTPGKGKQKIDADGNITFWDSI